MTYTLRFLIASLPLLFVSTDIAGLLIRHLHRNKKVLDRFVGTWRTEYKHRKTEWTPVAKTGASDLTSHRILGWPSSLQEQGTHDDKKTQLLLYTYDKEEKCYRSWYFSSSGQTSEGTGDWDVKTTNTNMGHCWKRRAGLYNDRKSIFCERRRV